MMWQECHRVRTKSLYKSVIIMGFLKVCKANCKFMSCVANDSQKLQSFSLNYYRKIIIYYMYIYSLWVLNYYFLLLYNIKIKKNLRSFTPKYEILAITLGFKCALRIFIISRYKFDKDKHTTNISVVVWATTTRVLGFLD